MDPNAAGKIVARKCDVTDESEVLSTFQWIKENFSRLDVFVNNAGIIKSDFILGKKHGPFHEKYEILKLAYFSEGQTSDFKKVFDVNVISACVCIRESVKLIKASGNGGHIIVINR